MKIKTTLALSLLFIFVTSAFANHHWREEKKDVSVSVSLPALNGQYVVERHHTRFVPNPPRHPHHPNYVGVRWVNTGAGYPIPQNAVVGGGEPRNTLYVCHADYRGGVHPGKVVGGNCNIGWGGSEISLTNYQMLVSNTNLGWVPARNGEIPPNAIAGGYENGRPLYICQAQYRHGTHPGKVIGQACNFGWGGQEISVPYYNVLVG